MSKMKLLKKTPEIPKPRRTGRKRIYLFEEMKVGTAAEMDASYQTIYTCITRFKEKPEYANWEFTIRRNPEDHAKCMVWRTK